MTERLNAIRQQIDATDKELLQVIAKRLSLVKEVGEIKSKTGTPVYVPEREIALLTKRKEEAQNLGINPSVIEDVLRRLMRESYGAESAGFKCVNEKNRKVVIIGGKGGMGRIFMRHFEASGYETAAFGSKGWGDAPEILKDAGLVIVCVPIDRTEEVIRKLSYLPEDCILADFTSTKTKPLQWMLETHKGPVVGLHPMFGPDVSNLAKQLIIWVDGRDSDKASWLFEQMKIWGANVQKFTAEEHDNAMGYIQALRHFTTFCYGVFMANENSELKKIMNLSSPIYHMELMMVGRLFAQDASLYADIILSNRNNLAIIERYSKELSKGVELLRQGNREAFIEEFQKAKNYFGEYANFFLHESKEVLAKLHDAKTIIN